MISIVTCSINPKKLALLQQSLVETTFHPYELIVIDNTEHKYSICSAYNFGASKSKFEYLCFVHEDIIFKTQNWDINFINHFEKNANISLIGVVGNTVKTAFPSGVYSIVQHTNRMNQLQAVLNEKPIHYYHNPKYEMHSEVATLDGMLLGTKKIFWQKYNFDDLTLMDFHGYDIDFSLAMAQLGKVVVVYDMLIEHASSGGNTVAWIESQLKITKKWSASLPVQIEADHKTLREREIDDLNQFAISLLRSRYSLKLAYQFCSLAFLRRPFQRINLFFLKHLMLQTFNGSG
ncbi:glycosyltransferase [Pedobacter sp. KLB.chiD]|uniref:glycosyltransferase n=1 Tax=Pedobacter sp. KLB.chiD TaxID=3387402 RepID=UPI00399A5145